MKKNIFGIAFFIGSVLSCSHSDAQSGIISTIAGVDTAGYSGNGGPATAAELNYPGNVAIDVTGNIYISDENNLRIRKISSATGIITTLYGNGSTTLIDVLRGIAIDTSGNVYFADKGLNRVSEINASGGVISAHFAGNGTEGFSGDGGPANLAKLARPSGIAIDGVGNLYIADESNQRVRIVNGITGIITTLAGNGVEGYGGDGGAATLAQLNFPSGVAVDASGNVYIADNVNHCVRMVNTSGMITTIAGNGSPGFMGDGGPATAAELYNPNGVTVDASGNVYIADQNNQRVREVSSATGIITTIAGIGTVGFTGDGGSAVDAQIYFPASVTLDASSNLYIADQGNNRIRKVTATLSGVPIITGNNDLEVYPNPTTTELTIASINQPITNVALSSILGQTVYCQNYNSLQIQIDVTPLPTGIYFVKVNGSEVRKFVKE